MHRQHCHRQDAELPRRHQYVRRNRDCPSDRRAHSVRPDRRVDDFPFARDYTETRVISNHIKTEGAYFRVAIACGPTSWSPWGPGHTLNFGGHVLHNLIGPGQFGYGITLSGVKGWTVQGNVLAPATRFAGSTHRFYPNIVNAPPAAFVREWLDRGRVHDSDDLQPDFVDGELQWVIGIEPEVGDKLEYEQGQVSLDVRGHSRAGEGGIALRGARWEVTTRGAFVLRKVEGHVDRFGMGEYGNGKVLWSSGTPLKSKDHHSGDHTPVHEPQLDFRPDGVLTLRSHGGTGETLWDPLSYLVPYLRHLPAPPSQGPPPTEPQPPERWIPHSRLVLQNKQPYLQLREHGGNVVYSTAYEYGNQDGWVLRAGQWIAIAPKELRGHLDPHEAATEGPPPPPPGAGSGANSPPPVPPRHGHFSRFVKDISSTLQQHRFGGGSEDHPGGSGSAPPPIPPRPGAPAEPASAAAGSPHPTFFYLSPDTCQLFLHSSPHGPTRPVPESVHWCSAPAPPEKNAKDPWVSFQGDGNVVMCALPALTLPHVRIGRRELTPTGGPGQTRAPECSSRARRTVLARPRSSASRALAKRTDPQSSSSVPTDTTSGPRGKAAAGKGPGRICLSQSGTRIEPASDPLDYYL